MNSCFIKKFKKQKNFCGTSYKKAGKICVDPIRISYNKSFWKNKQPFFCEKRKIALVNNNSSNNKTLMDNKKKHFEDRLVLGELINFS